MSTQHTPTPTPYRAFRGYKHREAYFVVGADGLYVAKIYGLDGQPVEENKDFFLRACNCHDELVAACEACVDSLVDAGRDHVDSVQFARAILAKVKSAHE